MMGDNTSSDVENMRAGHERDRQVLQCLFDSCDDGGKEALRGRGWGPRPVEEWVGVRTEQRRVIGLELSDMDLNCEIPPSVGLLNMLEQLVIERCGLRGTVKDGIGMLSRLRTLSLELNQLSGSIPSSLGKLTELRKLALFRNNLDGKIPAALGNLGALSRLDLSHNQLEGEIPVELGELHSLKYLHLNANKLEGELPTALSKLSNLRRFTVDHNRLGGKLPDAWLKNNVFTKLEAIDVSDNRINSAAININKWQDLITRTDMFRTRGSRVSAG